MNLFSCLATVASVPMGLHIFTLYFSPLAQFGGLVTYVNIDPAADKGGAYTDAGEVYFKEGSRVDTERATAFRSNDVFCVAPIVRDEATASGGAPANGASASSTSVDWWAVGTNCCQPPQGELFKCGAGNAQSRSGLRLLDSARRPMFKLAVDEWVAEYGVQAKHPLFFEWVKDPRAELAALEFYGWILITQAAQAVFVF